MKVPPQIGDRLYFLQNLLRCLAKPVVNDRNPLGGQRIQSLRMIRQKLRRSILHIEYKHPQSLPSHNIRIQQTKSSSRQIPWIRRQSLPCLLLLRIVRLKILVGHIHLAPQLQIIKGQRKRTLDIVNHKSIFSNIFPYKSIAPGFRQIKLHGIRTRHPAVSQRHRKPVHLGFH